MIPPTIIREIDDGSGTTEMVPLVILALRPAKSVLPPKIGSGVNDNDLIVPAGIPTVLTVKMAKSPSALTKPLDVVTTEFHNRGEVPLL